MIEQVKKFIDDYESNLLSLMALDEYSQGKLDAIRDVKSIILGDRYKLWECNYCKDRFITDSKSRWSMVGCKCGKTSVDDEEYYQRHNGSAKLITKSNNKEDLKEKK